MMIHRPPPAGGNLELTSEKYSRTVFNIHGNDYRLIARVNYSTKRVFVLHILTHAQYDKGDWKR